MQSLLMLGALGVGMVGCGGAGAWSRGALEQTARSLWKDGSWPSGPPTPLHCPIAAVISGCLPATRLYVRSFSSGLYRLLLTMHLSDEENGPQRREAIHEGLSPFSA